MHSAAALLLVVLCSVAANAIKQSPELGTLWAAACATDLPAPTCGLYALDLSNNPVTVTEYFQWAPPVSDPFDQFASSAIDLTRDEIWIFEGDCNGQMYRISLRDNQTFSTIQLPSPAVCIAHSVYDMETDMLYLIGTTANADPEVMWFITIDPATSAVASMQRLATNQTTGMGVLHPFNSLSTIDGTRGTYITTFCCNPNLPEGRQFVNISLANGNITGFTPGGEGILQTRYYNGEFFGYAFGALVTIDLSGSGDVTPFLALPNNATGNPADQLMGVWSPILSDPVTFVQLWHTSPDTYFVTVVTDYTNVQTIPVKANRFTFAPQGNAPWPWRPTFFFEGQYQPPMF